MGEWAKGRRQQIKKSFDQAIKDSPRQWVLVLTRNPTPKERAWVHKLGGKLTVQISIWGRARLDSEFAKHADLLHAATRDPLVETLKYVGQERPGLVRKTDLDAELTDLQGRIAGRSLHWGVAVEVDHESITQRLYPKTPDAHIEEPITFTFGVDTSVLDPATRDSAERYLDYGSGEPLSLPAEAIKDFEVSGPDWIANSSDDVSITLGSRPWIHDAVELRSVDEDGYTMRSLRGDVTAVNRGRKGQRLDVVAAGGLNLEFLIAAEGHGVTLNLMQNVAGEDAVDVLAGIEMTDSFTTAHALQLLRHGEPLISLRSEIPAGSAPTPPPYERLLAEDLAAISAYSRIRFEMPVDLLVRERREIRRLRLMLDGRAVVEPAFGELNAELGGGHDGEPDEGFERLIRGEALPIRVGPQTLVYDVLSHQVPLRDVTLYHPALRLVDAEGARRALEGGTFDNHPITLRGVDNSPFWAFLLGKQTDPNAPITPASLNIPGIENEPWPASGAAVEEPAPESA